MREREDTPFVIISSSVISHQLKDKINPRSE
jgi:hypothetical protein